MKLDNVWSWIIIGYIFFTLFDDGIASFLDFCIAQGWLMEWR